MKCHFSREKTLRRPRDKNYGYLLTIEIDARRVARALCGISCRFLQFTHEEERVAVTLDDSARFSINKRVRVDVVPEVFASKLRTERCKKSSMIVKCVPRDTFYGERAGERSPGVRKVNHWLSLSLPPLSRE